MNNLQKTIEEKFNNGEYVKLASSDWNDDNIEGYKTCQEDIKQFVCKEIPTEVIKYIIGEVNKMEFDEEHTNGKCSYSLLSICSAEEQKFKMKFISILNNLIKEIK